MCDIRYTIVLNNDDKIINDRIMSNIEALKLDSFEKIIVEDLSYYSVEKAISDKYNLGFIQT